MKNYRLNQYLDMCYFCNYYCMYDETDTIGYDYCDHPTANKKEVEPIGICDNFDDSIYGN